jgi:ketosteroid isomerase-like protein
MSLITELRKRGDEFFRVRNADALSAAWDPDGVLITGGPQPITGLPAYRDSLARVWKRPNIVLLHTPEKVDMAASGDMAFESGRWEERWQDADGAMTLKGSYFTTWKKVGTVWKVIAETLKPLECIGGAYCKK